MGLHDHVSTGSMGGSGVAGMFGGHSAAKPLIEPTRDFLLTSGLPAAFTFTRSSPGTYRDSSPLIQTAGNNISRFDHDGTGNDLGHLVEEARTNLCLQSEDLGTTWTNDFGGGVTLTTNAAIAPDGTMTADQIARIDAGSDGVQQTISLTANTVYTVSCFFKNVNADQSQLRMWNQSGGPSTLAEVRFNWTSGVPTTAGSANATNISYTNFGNDWWRVAYAFTSDAVNSTDQRPVFHPEVTGANGNSIYAWGCKVEAGAFPTSYTGTTTVAVSRSAELLSITGSNFSDFYNPIEGTFLLAAGGPPSGIDARVTIDDGSSAERIVIRRKTDDTVDYFTVTAGGAGVGMGETDTSWVNGVFRKVAFVYKLNEWSMSFAGRPILTDVTGVVPSGLSRIEFSGVGGGNYWNSYFQRLSYWPIAFTETQLRSISL